MAELRTAHDRLAGELRERAERAEAAVARLREAVVAERERANAALARVAEAEARLTGGSPTAQAAAQAVKALRAFLGQWKRGRT